MPIHDSNSILQQRIRLRDEYLIAADYCEEAGMHRAAAALREKSLNLPLFCSDDYQLYPDTAIPFVLNGVKYATDRRVILAIPTDEPDTPLRRRDLPTDFSAIMPAPVGRWRAWPEIERTTLNDEQEVQVVGTIPIAAELDDKIRTLPNLEWSATVNAYTLAFRFTGGEGRVGGIRQRDAGGS